MSERRERLGRIAYEVNRSFPAWNVLPTDDWLEDGNYWEPGKESWSEVAEAVAAAVDAEYAPLLEAAKRAYDAADDDDLMEAGYAMIEAYKALQAARKEDL